MIDYSLKSMFTDRVNRWPLQGLAKNFSAPCSVTALAKGITITFERCLAWHAEIFRNFPAQLRILG